MVERRGDIREDSLQFHPQTMFSLYLECRQEEKDLLIAEFWERGSRGITESDLPDGRCGLRAFFDNDDIARSFAGEFAGRGARWRVEESRDWVEEARSRLQPM